MIYLLYGQDNFLINKEIKSILKKENIDALSLNEYDLNNDLLEDVILDCETISLFGNKKGIIINNSYIFTAKKNSIEQKLDTLEQYLEAPNPDTIMIFTLNEDKLDERKKLVKTIKKRAEVKALDSTTNTISIAKEMFGDYKISNADLNLLVDRIGKNLSLLEQEINKIMVYKGEEKEITRSDIINLTNKNIDVDIFKLIEAVIKKDKKTALEIYYEMLKYNEEPIKIIIMLANQFRIIYQSKEMYQKGYTEADIAKTLDIHPYRIKLALQNSRNYHAKALLEYIKKLANLDINIKKGNIDKCIGLELFIINL